MNLEKLILTTPDKEKTQSEIEKIVANAKIKYNVHEISVIHYIGEFYTGDMLFLVAVLGNHRGETFGVRKISCNVTAAVKIKDNRVAFSRAWMYPRRFKRAEGFEYP